MSQPGVSLMIAVLNHTVCIKIAGRANFTCSVDLKRVVTELAERGYKHFVLDLSECVLMDSTFLGILAGIGLRFSPQNSKPGSDAVELLNPNQRIADLLENLGVAHLFKITKGDGCQQTFETVSPAEQTNRAEVTRTCLEAHRTLMAVNPENIQKFKDVTQFLAEDLKRIEQQK